MPNIDDYKPRAKTLIAVEKRLKNPQGVVTPFIKKPYRPWNLTGKELDVPKLDTKQVPLDTDIDTKQVPLDTKKPIHGLQKKVLLYIVKHSILTASRKSIMVRMDDIETQIKSTYGAIKTAIHRLVQKGIIQRENGQTGRGGFLLFTISEEVKNEFERFFLKSELDTDIDTKQVPMPPSVSSSIYITNTTTNTPVDNFSFPDEWEEIDIEPLAFIKFTKAHLDQIYKAGKISPDLLQASIHSFAFDLQINDKAKVLKLSPINVFMGMMKKGSPYLPPENYESPEEQAMKAYLDAMKKKAERIRKLEEECKALALQEWRDGLSLDEQKAIVPEKYHAASEKKIFESLIIAHFEKKIWQSINPPRKISTLAI